MVQVCNFVPREQMQVDVVDAIIDHLDYSGRPLYLSNSDAPAVFLYLRASLSASCTYLHHLTSH